MCGFGPGAESQAHAPNEITWKQDLVTCAALYAAVPSLYKGRERKMSANIAVEKRITISSNWQIIRRKNVKSNRACKSSGEASDKKLI
jgi:hypothetical protein